MLLIFSGEPLQKTVKWDSPTPLTTTDIHCRSEVNWNCRMMPISFSKDSCKLKTNKSFQVLSPRVSNKVKWKGRIQALRKNLNITSMDMGSMLDSFSTFSLVGGRTIVGAILSNWKKYKKLAISRIIEKTSAFRCRSVLIANYLT